MVQRQDSNATFVNEASLGMHRKERTMIVEVSELDVQGNGVVSSVVHVPGKTL